MGTAPGALLNRPLRLGLGLALVLILVDQASKWAILEGVFGLPFLGLPFASFPWERPVEITGFFNLVTVWNRGVSFGLFANDHGLGPYILSGVAIAISAFLVHLLRQSPDRLGIVAYGMVIGGALGNVIDRLRFGAVFDFLDFHVAGWHWPAFNVADSCIFLGVCLILYDGLVAKRPKDA